MQETPKTDFNDESLSSSELFALMQKAESVSEYRALFDQYWEKRKAERIRSAGAQTPGPAAQDRSEGTQKSSRRKAGRRQAKQDERRGEKP